jgi:plasmid stabilization system protein ParE
VIQYVAEDSLEGARHLLRQALAAGRSLEALSERGRIVPEFADPAIREIFVFRYRLIYRVESDRVSVLAFIHGAREFSRWRRGL